MTGDYHFSYFYFFLYPFSFLSFFYLNLLFLEMTTLHDTLKNRDVKMLKSNKENYWEGRVVVREVREITVDEFESNSSAVVSLLSGIPPQTGSLSRTVTSRSGNSTRFFCRQQFKCALFLQFLRIQELQPTHSLETVSLKSSIFCKCFYMHRSFKMFGNSDITNFGCLMINYDLGWFLFILD